MPELTRLTRAHTVARWRQAAHRRRLALTCVVGAAATALVLAFLVPVINADSPRARLTAADTKAQDTTYRCLGSGISAQPLGSGEGILRCGRGHSNEKGSKQDGVVWMNPGTRRNVSCGDAPMTWKPTSRTSIVVSCPANSEPEPTLSPTSTTSPAPTSSGPATPTPTKTTPTVTATMTTTPPPTTSPASSGGTYSCVQTGNQGRCNYPANQNITGANGNPYVDQNIWSGGNGYKQVLYGASPTDWYVMAKANTNFGGVLTYPNVGFDMTGTVDSKSSTTSSWSTSMPHDSKIASWAAYDLWFNDWEDEVMIQTDIAANSYYDCDNVATATFGGMPWHMCQFGAERVWKPGTDDSHKMNMAKGSIDIKAILVWMEQNGHLPKNSTWTAGSYGFEVCDTGGTDAKFWVNGFTWHSK